MTGVYYDPIWNTWTTTISNGTSSTTYQNLGYAINSATWNSWNNNNSTITYTTRNYQPEPETEEQRTEREAQLEQIRERVHARRHEHKKIKERARTLLRSVLTEEQWRDWETLEQFTVVGSHGGRYRIMSGSVGNVYWFDDNGDIARYCAHPQLVDAEGRNLPNEDVLAAQTLALMTDEAQFIRTANVHHRYRPIENPLERQEPALAA